MYSDKHPTQIEKEIRKKKDWSRIVGERPWSKRTQESEPVPGPSSLPPERSSSPEGTSSGSGDDKEVESCSSPHQIMVERMLPWPDCVRKGE